MNYNIKEKKESSKIANNSSARKEKRIKYKAIKIPKLLLNDNKKNIFSQGIAKNISSNNFIFIQNPRMKELSKYYYSKNRSLINEVSSNSKRKLKIMKTSVSEGINNNIITKKKNLNVRSRLFDYKINKKNINNSAPNNTINKNKNENIEDYMNKSFLSSKFDDPLLKFKVKKYLKKKLNERYNLYALINFPFDKKNKGKITLYSNSDRKLFLKRLIKPKKIDSDIYDTILDEYKNAKSTFDSNKTKQNEIFGKNILKYKLNRNNLGNKIFKSNFATNVGKIQNSLVEKQVNLIKLKLNNNYTNNLKLDFLNEFNTKLHLSLSNSQDQLFNTRLYAKFINDNSYIKNLIEEVPNKYIKKA